MKQLARMIIFFEKITTGVLFVTAVYIPVFYGWSLEIHVEILWQILLLSAVCTLGSVILPLEGEREVSKRAMLLCDLLYYVYVNAAVLILGWRFEWFSFQNQEQVLGMILAIAFVYLAASAVTYWAQYKEAKKMNQKLKERG